MLSEFPGGIKHFQPSHSPVYTLPLAETTIEIEGHTLNFEVTVEPDLQYDVLLGHDISFIWDLTKNKEFIGVIQTRYHQMLNDEN